MLAVRGSTDGLATLDRVSGSAVIDDLLARGLIQDHTDLEALRERLDRGPITLYVGFDPSAESLHVGNLVPLLLLRRFQLAGHLPIALAGGATGMIGDPGGRSEERNLLDGEALDRNTRAIKAQLAAFLDFEPGPFQARLVDNRDWTAPIGVLDFLRDVGKHVTVNYMLAKESVRSRVASEHGISYTEFSYMLLQANDYAWLHEHTGCELQAGGSDQWGNITAGIDLTRRRSGASVHGLTVPLVTRSDGEKFGKSVGGALWLDPQRTSPYALYQYFLNVPDAEVERFLLQLTLVPVDEARRIAEEHARAPERRTGQARLAWEVCALIHGAEAADEAAAASTGFTAAAGSLSADQLAALSDEIPTTHAQIAGRDVVDLLVESTLAASKGEARRLIAGGGIYVNDVALPESRALGAGDLLHGRYVMLRKGKRQRHLLVSS
ncbi:MAG: tyrosyl-tRNA synthetase [Gaiellales bacterium]|nr:tyrosyl-tRNA synthetase [Gaiellales bacterium]